jgi:hypothetical protein
MHANKSHKALADLDAEYARMHEKHDALEAKLDDLIHRFEGHLSTNQPHHDHGHLAGSHDHTHNHPHE